MTTTIKIGKVTKMASAGIGNSNPSVIGESTVDGKRIGLIYQIFYNCHSVTVEIEGIRNTGSKRKAVKQSVVNHFVNHN